MAILETKGFPNPTFLGFPNSIDFQLFFQFFYFNSNSNSGLTLFFLTDILTENEKLECRF